MAYRPKPKGASVSRTSPRAWATDDRTGFIVNHNKLRSQFEWAGDTLINKRILTRAKSLDKPQPQFRTQHIPPDPKPVMNARVENYTLDESGPLLTSIATAAATGATTIFVSSVTGFSVSQKIYVYLDNGGFSFQTILSIDTIGVSFGLSTPLPSSAAIGRNVVASGASDVNE